MECASRLNAGLPLHIFITVLQFAVPEMMSKSETRLVSKAVLSALARTTFWYGMSIDLHRDEGDDRPPRQSSCGGTVGKLSDDARSSFGSTSPNGGNNRQSSPGEAVGELRSIADSNFRRMIGPKTRQGHNGTHDVGARIEGGGVRGDGGGSNSSLRKRSCEAVSGSEGTNTDKGGGERGGVRHPAALGGGGSGGSEFLRRYHHHVAFRRLAPPVVDTHTVDMPMSLYPTCLDACGAMVAVGTRQGPVIIFHVGPTERSSKGNDPPSRHDGSENPQRDDRDNQDCATVYRAYGSLSKGEGPISDVVLDRSKLLVAGRCSGVDGGDGRPVIRMYDVESTRLLRTLKCMDEVSRICLFDPVIAVQYLSLGCLSFRDIYAESSTGLVQRRTSRLFVAGFAVVEIQQPFSRYSNREGCGGRDGIVLHCTDANGVMFEASTSCETWNKERNSANLGLCKVLQAWQVHADMDAMLLIQVSPRGIVRGWRLQSNGSRINGSLFVFGMDPSSSTSSSSASATFVPRRVLSASLGAGGTILATALVGTAPRLWDVRIERRSRMGSKTAGVPTGGGSTGGAVSNSLGRAPSEVFDGGRVWGLASLDKGRRRMNVNMQGMIGTLVGGEHVGREGGDRDWQTRPRCVGIRPWPTGVWALGVIVDAGRGRVVSACSDRRVRITRLRPNNREQRLRTALLLCRRQLTAKTVSGRQSSLRPVADDSPLKK